MPETGSANRDARVLACPENQSARKHMLHEIWCCQKQVVSITSGARNWRCPKCVLSGPMSVVPDTGGARDARKLWCPMVPDTSDARKLVEQKVARLLQAKQNSPAIAPQLLRGRAAH